MYYLFKYLNNILFSYLCTGATFRDIEEFVDSSDTLRGSLREEFMDCGIEYLHCGFGGSSSNA